MRVEHYGVTPSLHFVKNSACFYKFHFFTKTCRDHRAAIMYYTMFVWGLINKKILILNTLKHASPDARLSVMSLTHLCHWHCVTVYYLPVYMNGILETTSVNACLLVLGATAPSGPWPHLRGF